MVAYNFKKQFAPLIEQGIKTQTIRKERSRHAKPGESVQLYTGMRSKFCRKLIDPDPVCVSVQSIVIADEVHLDGVLLLCHEVEMLAIADGFSGIPAFVRFFKKSYGLPFKGVLIKWK